MHAEPPDWSIRRLDTAPLSRTLAYACAISSFFVLVAETVNEQARDGAHGPSCGAQDDAAAAHDLLGLAGVDRGWCERTPDASFPGPSRSLRRASLLSRGLQDATAAKMATTGVHSWTLVALLHLLALTGDPAKPPWTPARSLRMRLWRAQ